MPDAVVWPAEPHTLAKHAILERYLQAWFPILSRQSAKIGSGTKEILFVDGFAGPGEYSGGEPGSPILALRAALEHSVDFPVPVRFLFIEQDEARCRHLQQVLARYQQQVARSRRVRLSTPREGDCDSVLANLLNEIESKGTHFGQSLAFLDQFGFSAVSMELVKRILKFPQCEVFLYLDYKDMNRFITDPAKAAGFTRTYGGEEWRGAIALPESQRREFLLGEYVKALRNRARVKYVCAFSMFDDADCLLYWLIFCTNNLRGLEEMKKAMWKVDETGCYRFSDKDNPSQLPLLAKAFDQPWLAETLAARFSGRTVTTGQIKEHVLVQTPCYLYKEALRLLELCQPQRIEVPGAPPNRRRGTFSDEGMRIKFAQIGPG